MPNQKPADSQTEVLIPVLESQVIPCYERFGLERLAVTAETLKQFRAQSLPPLMQTSVKKRVGAKVVARSRRTFNNTSSYLESWPNDDQAAFRYPTLSYVLEGQADFHVGDYVVSCPQDHFLLFRTDVPRPFGRRPHFESEDAAKRYCAVLWFFAPPGTNSVSVSICHSQGSRHWKEGNFDYCAVHRPEVVQVYKLLIHELESRPLESPKIANLSFQTFLQLFLRELKQGRFHRAGRSSTPSTAPESTSPIKEAQQYVKIHLNQPLTAAGVAKEVYMSRNTFIRHFADETGQTFHDFVLEQRMEEAKRLLSEGYLSLSFICPYIGLKPSQFRLQFKKHFGVAPSQFRKDLQRKVQDRR